MRFSFADASAFCLSQFGAQLVSVNSGRENTVVNALGLAATSAREIWTGGFFLAAEGNQLQWSDGTAVVDFGLPFKAGQPSFGSAAQSCLMLNLRDASNAVELKWEVRGCNTRRGFVSYSVQSWFFELGWGE